MAVLAPGDTIIHIRVTGASGKGVLVDENNVEIPIDPLPPTQMEPSRPGTQRHFRRNGTNGVCKPNGFKLVGTLYHGHSSPGCLYWIGNTPVILPCP